MVCLCSVHTYLLDLSPLVACWWLSIPAFWAFLWFVGFCFLTNQWQASKEEDNPLNEGADAARAAITFSFFSIFTWVSKAAVMLYGVLCGVLACGEGKVTA